MKIFYRYLVPILFVLTANSCSPSVPDKNHLSNQIKIFEVQAWLNLMPGGPGSFHIIGKYSFLSNLNEQKIFLNKLTILIDEKIIYTIIPEIQLVKSDLNGTTEFLFHNEGNLKIDQSLKDKNEIAINFIFTYGDEIIEKTISQVELTRAY